MHLTMMTFGSPLKCGEVMTQDVQHCSTDEPIESVLQRLRAANASFIAVCDAAGTIVGAVSERDFALESRTREYASRRRARKGRRGDHVE